MPDPVDTLPFDWSGYTCIVCATGPSFTEEQATRVIACQMLGAKVIAVNDAYRRVPEPDIVYACDLKWWKHHLGRSEQLASEKFDGRRVSAHPSPLPPEMKVLRVRGGGRASGNQHGPARKVGRVFERTPWTVTWASSSGFQAVGLALHTGADPIVLVGFDGGIAEDGTVHFFGKHPSNLNNPTDHALRKISLHFEAAAQDWPEAKARIKNATPGSSITCFEEIDL